MVKHIVLFKLKPELTVAQRAAVGAEFKQAIEALPTQIACLRRVEVGLNVNPDEQFDVALYSEFDSLEDVRAYAVHPAHVAAAGIIRPHVAARACSDYEVD